MQRYSLIANLQQVLVEESTPLRFGRQLLTVACFDALVRHQNSPLFTLQVSIQDKSFKITLQILITLLHYFTYQPNSYASNCGERMQLGH